VVHPQQVESAILDVQKLVFGASDGGNVHVVARRGDVLVFLAVEDVDGDQVDFIVFVLRFDDLAGTSLDDDVTEVKHTC
jgi:hypothetical protein